MSGPWFDSHFSVWLMHSSKLTRWKKHENTKLSCLLYLFCPDWFLLAERLWGFRFIERLAPFSLLLTSCDGKTTLIDQLKSLHCKLNHSGIHIFVKCCISMNHCLIFLFFKGFLFVKIVWVVFFLPLLDSCYRGRQETKWERGGWH